MDGIELLKEFSKYMHLERGAALTTDSLSESGDASCPDGVVPRVNTRDRIRPHDTYISSAAAPGGKRISLVKTMITSACERNCYYCPFRAGRDFRRATFSPQGLADTFMSVYRAGVAQGVFISSGIINGGIHTQDQLLDTADILRNRLGYRGYLHLKIMPGAEYDQVYRAMQLADRISVNLEAPNTQRLRLLAPRKQFTNELVQPLRWIEEIRKSSDPYNGWNGKWPSSVTQFVVGAVGEADIELLTTTQELYQQMKLKRAYFSRFNPISDTPLENHSPTSPKREQRLYQASFLLRDYGFDVEQLPFDREGNLLQAVDPKLAWAQNNLIQTPVELNRAAKSELLRIPGVGPIIAERIIRTRKKTPIKDLSVLNKLGAHTGRLAPFILLDGKKPPQQEVFEQLAQF